MTAKRVFSYSAMAVLLALGIANLHPAASTGPTVDHRVFGDLLKKYVEDGQVDYAGFQSE